MTRRQLDLLIDYINTKAEKARREARGEHLNRYDTDRLVEIVAELEESCEAE